MKTKAGGRRGGKRMQRRGRRSIRRNNNGVPDKAGVSEKVVLTAQVPGSNPPTYSQSISFNTIVQNYNMTLLATNRARAVAAAYQFYRIKRITYRFKPEVTMYPPGSAIPMLYWFIDKNAQAIPWTSAGQFRSAGCRGTPFNREITVSFAPAVLQGALDNQPAGLNVFAKPLVSPWLATNQTPYTPGVWNASQIDHTGISFIVESNAALPQAQVFYKVEQELEFEFKKPYYNYLPSEGEQLPVVAVNPNDGPVEANASLRVE